MNPSPRLLTLQRVYSALMKRFLLSCSLLVALFAALSPAALAQDVRRVVLLPFNTSDSAQVYGLGLATAVQRSLNVLDAAYSPPVGDALLYAQGLISQNRVSAAAIAGAFDASVVVSGEVVASGDTATVTLGFAGPSYPEVESETVTAPLENPAALVAEVLGAVVAKLELPVSGDDRRQLDAVAAATPSLASLAAVSQGALRLPGASLSDLQAAAELDAGSSWVLSEYARALALSGRSAQATEVAERAVQANPSDVEAQVVRGVVLSSALEPQSAREAFAAALDLNPNHPLALVGMARLGTDPEAATQQLERAISIYPRLVDAYLALAELQAESNPQQALQTLRRGAQRVPESAQLQRSLINIAIASGDAAGALSYLRDTVLGSGSTPANLYSLAELLPDPYLDQALELVRQGRERYPESQSLVLAEARLLERQGDLAGAEALLGPILAANPQNVEVANTLALLQARQGETEAARGTLQGAQGQSATADYNLAQLYLQAGQSEAALALLEPLVQQSPDDAGLQTAYGVALARLGRAEEARAALSRALELEPGLEEASRALSVLEQETALTGGKRVALGAAAAQLFQEGKAAFEAGNYAEAARAFTAAREQQDEGIIAFFQGLTLYLSGQTRPAVAAYERALESYPESDVVLNNLGLAQLQLGRLDQALPNLEQAVAANDENANAHLNLGLVNYQLRRYADAVAQWERAIALDPSLESAVAERLADARSRADQ